MCKLTHGLWAIIMIGKLKKDIDDVSTIFKIVIVGWSREFSVITESREEYEKEFQYCGIW